MNRWSQKIGRALLLALFTLVGPIGPARAADKSGLDSSRLKLPKGPGSIEGLGENADPSVNMGTVSYAVPISLPAGQGGFGPSLKVAYHSGDGNSEVGLGWSLGLSTSSQ